MTKQGLAKFASSDFERPSELLLSLSGFILKRFVVGQY